MSITIVSELVTTPTESFTFGCWICKVVQNEVTLGHLIDNVEEWMEPLVEIKDFMKNTLERSNQIYDAHKSRMNGRRNSADGIGPD